MTDLAGASPAWPVALSQACVDALGHQSAVASSHPSITLEGARILADGGNAIDASLAMAATAWMVLPGQCGIGGDLFAIVREPDGRIWTVGGSGYGPDGASPEFFARGGHSRIPSEGPLSVSVPGAAAAIAVLGGQASRPLSALWANAIALARNGLPCNAKNRADISEHLRALQRDDSTRAVFTVDGQPPAIGAPIVQSHLADFLESLADDPLSFYTGEFAGRAVDFLQDCGAPFSGAEWALTAEVAQEPAVSAQYLEYTLHQTPTPSPGWMVLHQAGLLEGLLGDLPLLGVDALEAFASAARASFDFRYRHCATDNEAWRIALDPMSLSAQRAALARQPWGSGLGMSIDGDTTTSVCVDDQGRAVSLIHSLAFTFGARIAVPGTGVLLNNRLGRGAYLVPGHPNEVAPRRKPMHTLNAWIVEDSQGRLRHLGNCPGGDGQVQWNMQLISHLCDHRLSPAQAVSLPRLTVWPGSDADSVEEPSQVRVEAGVDPAALASLRDRLTHVVKVPAQVGGPGGSAMVISRDPDSGLLRAGADPRMQGLAIAF